MIRALGLSIQNAKIKIRMAARNRPLAISIHASHLFLTTWFWPFDWAVDIRRCFRALDVKADSKYHRQNSSVEQNHGVKENSTVEWNRKNFAFTRAGPMKSSIVRGLKV